MVNQAIQRSLDLRIEKFKAELSNTLLKDLDVKPLEGKGDDIEKKIIESQLMKH